MPVEVTYPHIEKIPGESARLKRLPRIRIAQIVIDYLNHGWSADEICIHYPHLKLAEVHSAMAYYFDHQPERSPCSIRFVRKSSRTRTPLSSRWAPMF